MRKAIRLILALIFGFVAFEVVELWPVRPMWSLADAIQTPVGFSKDGQSLFAIHGMHQRGSYRSGTSIEFVKRDAHTGECQAITSFSFNFDFQILDFSPNGDFTKILFFGMKAHRDRDAETGDFLCFLFDTRNGHCLGGPWECGNSQDVVLSPDAGWIHKPPSPLRPESHHCLISTANGKEVELPSSSLGEYRGYCLFSEDSSKLTLLTSNQYEKYLHILTMPSGESIGCYDLPNEDWHHPHHWQGDTIALSYFSSSAQGPKQGLQSFQLSHQKATKLSPEPLLHVESRADKYLALSVQSNTVIHLRMRKAAWPDFIITFLEWCDEQFKTQWCSRLPERTTFRIFDRKTEKHRLDISIGALQQIRMNQSGSLLASLEGWPKSVLSVWNINPFSRLPWAFGAAFLTFIFVVFFPRLRSRAKPRQAISA